ncbi:FeoB-associated Cys-rich membrane protein [Massilibacteroides sp.]|uniref:FeoB-associated Cys-rich membrane protein n=1 Tax=Massilibacteroides sp. TaxID=2034766 RepID=UPI00263646CE|nr:FeoB-associated Cys-rich membrane protein [Massilibacteroides sp.]MDD4516769.1 FeoB-associated Cys-rich membrane protein [Massilibacteroides sp.]
MWQEIAVIATGIVTLIYVGWKIYRFFTEQKNASGMCGGCTGCNLSQKGLRQHHCR